MSGQDETGARKPPTVKAHSPREVWREEQLWEPLDGGPPWLVGFHFAELGGVPACVGVTIRSYLAIPQYSSVGGRREAWVPPIPATQTQDIWGQRVRTGEGDADWSTVGEMLFDHEDGDVLRRVILDSDSATQEAFIAPRPLLATTVDKLPFFQLLDRARKNAARRAEYLAKESKRSSDSMPPGLSEVLSRVWSEEAEKMHARPPRPGRQSKYSQDDLRRVAEVYSAAIVHHVTGPTKLVAEVLGVSRSSASKLVAKCRKAGLLGQTEKRKAGGVLPQGGE